MVFATLNPGTAFVVVAAALSRLTFRENTSFDKGHITNSRRSIKDHRFPFTFLALYPLIIHELRQPKR